ncbi:CpsD/CapB family tyrosine-protein kinase [Anaeromyxobacter oryzae]|uniref:Polysaccharide chain length determinant N-terminal domain-containing protein n=1 Tax=Anaeromyxobacter oryzae TaxID=2918170 RepID=A0ABM7WV80_9BACT|nr:Wzz/FepE/Etk N-terminal domain-containing protein [Anaeromyxobacter oryzae]BDG03425.1 hypothetical protein AMOR_24210 [Anaeromyxobacter oryzae]
MPQSSIARYADVVVRHGRLVLSVAVAVLAAGIVYGLLARPVYRSTLLLHVDARDGGGRGAEVGVRSATEAAMESIGSRTLLGAVVDELHLETVDEPDGARHVSREQAIDDLHHALRVIEKGNGTGILQLTLDGEDPGRLAATLDAIAAACVRQDLERRRAEAARAVALLESGLSTRDEALRVVGEAVIDRIRVLDAASRPVSPVAPRRAVTAAAAALLGLALGAALALAWHPFVRVDEPGAIERATGVSVYAAVPFSVRQEQGAGCAERAGGASPILASVCPEDVAVEALRALRTGLLVELLDAPSRVVAVSTPAAGEGTSFVTVNVAHLLGELGRRVVVVDAELRRGHLHRSYGLEPGPGLAEVVGGQAGLAEVLRETASPNVRFLPAGTVPSDAPDLLASERFAAVLDELSRAADVVIVVTPPLAAGAGATIAARHAGLGLLVIRGGEHRLREVVAAVRRFSASGVRVHGIVMNAVGLRPDIERQDV